MAKKPSEYVPLPTSENASRTTDVQPSAEAFAVQRALLKRSEERVSLAPLEPADALRALLATPPGRS